MIILSGLCQTNFDAIDDEEKMKLVTMMHNSSRRGLDLLDNLLNWSQSQTKMIEFIPERFNFRETIDENVLFCREKAELKEIQINVNGSPDEEIFGDKNMLKTVVRNLLTNAIKFTNKGGEIVISTKLSDTNHVKFTISDNGVGMSKKVADNIFRIDSKYIGVGTNGERGTGLGLILCKEFILKHNGKIWAESREGEGSKFRFNIPMS